MLFVIARILPLTNALYSATLTDPKMMVSAKQAISWPLTVKEAPQPPLPCAIS